MQRTTLAALALLMMATTQARAQNPGTIYYRVGYNAYSVGGDGTNFTQLPLAVHVEERPLNDVSARSGYPVSGGRLLLSTDIVGTVADGGTTRNYRDVVALDRNGATVSRVTRFAGPDEYIFLRTGRVAPEGTVVMPRPPGIARAGAPDASAAPRAEAGSGG